MNGLHQRMWRLAIEATQDKAPLMAVVLPPINEVIDLHSTHLAMARRHLPIPIMTVLLGTATIGVGLLGFGNGRAGRRFLARHRLRCRSCGRSVDDHRLGLSGIGIIRVSNLMWWKPAAMK